MRRHGLVLFAKQLVNIILLEPKMYRLQLDRPYNALTSNISAVIWHNTLWLPYCNVFALLLFVLVICFSQVHGIHA